MKGRITILRSTFGFITTEGGQDIYFNPPNAEKDSSKKLALHDLVEFEVENKYGFQNAIQVRLAGQTDIQN